MQVPALVLLVAAFFAVGPGHAVAADKATVCTITVNSADEKEAFRRALPPDKFNFVELVERGRPDWLASACQQGIRCDVLVISGHYDGGHEFFSDRTEAQEFLPVDEMERVACSDSCPGLFSQLKDVYLFGCNTLNPEARKTASGELARSLLRSGHSRSEAERLARVMGERHGESARERMQLIFKGVPAIYGFSSVAPVGPTAASILNRYFQVGGAGEVGRGRASGKLQAAFTGHALTVTRGLVDADPRAAHRQDVCQFADERLSPARKLAFVHRLLGREMAEVRMFLDRLETFSVTLDATQRRQSAVAEGLDEIARDRGARERFLEFARDADRPAVRARMLDLAHNLGWLTAEERRVELVRMIGDNVGRNAVDAALVDLVCTLNKDGELGVLAPSLPMTPEQAGRAENAAVLACLDSPEAHARVLRALTSASDDDVRVAQVYLGHRPIADVGELRALTSDIARMSNPKAQARAVESLARVEVTDRESIEALARLFPVAESPAVQLAIAGVLLRADLGEIDPELVQTLLQHRPRSAGGGADTIGVLLRRLQVR